MDFLAPTSSFFIYDTLTNYFQEARALLGKLEYQRGNVEGALRVFDGIDLQAAIQRMQPSLGDKPTSKKGRSRSDLSSSQQASNLILEAVYLKAKSFQKLGKLTGNTLFNDFEDFGDDNEIIKNINQGPES